MSIVSAIEGDCISIFWNFLDSDELISSVFLYPLGVVVAITLTEPSFNTSLMTLDKSPSLSFPLVLSMLCMSSRNNMYLLEPLSSLKRPSILSSNIPLK